MNPWLVVLIVLTIGSVFYLSERYVEQRRREQEPPLWYEPDEED